MKKIALLLALLAGHSALNGSGFQVLEQGAGNLGTAMAGAAANANGDASAAFWNPSAGFFVDGKGRVDGGLSFLIPDFQLKNGKATYPLAAGGGEINGTDGGNAGKLAYVPTMYAIYKFGHDDRWLAALSVTAPYGLETEYHNGDTFIGRYHGIRSKLQAFDFNPSVAYKLSDNLSVGVGFSIQYVNAVLTSYMVGDTGAKVEGDGLSAGGNIGFTYQYMEGGRVGLSYRSQVNHQLSGTMYAKGNKVPGMPEEQHISADLTIPNTINFGIYQRLRGDLSRFAIMADYAWTTWSQFEELRIVGSHTTSVTEENWKNASRISVGVHYYPEFAEDNLVLRIGGCWDESPIHSPEFRTVRVPDSDRIWVSAGVGYRWGKFFIDVGYTYIFFNNSNMNNTTDTVMKGDVSGTYVGNAHVVGCSVGMRF